MSDYIKLNLMVGRSTSLLKINLVESLESIQYRSETLNDFESHFFFWFVCTYVYTPGLFIVTI